MSASKVALAMIIKGTADEAPLLDQCLANVAPHVDGIFLTLTRNKGGKIANNLRTVAEKYTKPQFIKVYEWEDNFVKARSFNFAQVPKDYDFILWLDSDDTVENPEKIKETAEVIPKSVSGVYACYDYAHDEYGNVTVPHYVARLVRNNGVYTWKSSFDDSEFSVHETLSETRSSGKRITEEWKVIHHSNPTRSFQSLYRNIDLLQKMYGHEVSKGRADPRILFYLGTHLFDAGEFKEAKRLLQDYMTLSGWNNERSEALVYLGLIYAMEAKPGQAKHAYVLAISEAPNNPRPYTEIAELELKDKRYDSAAEWALKAIECKKRQTAMALRPMDATFRPFMIYSKALSTLGGTRLEEAMKYVEKALKLRPLDPEVQDQRDLIEDLIQVRDLNRAFAKLVKALGGDKMKTQALLQAVPEKLTDSPLVAQVRHDNAEPRVWPRKSMAIWCGASVLETWGPSSLAGGVGGSEEAVIRLKVELEKLGWEVHVYATPGPDTDDTWHNYWEFNPNDKFDVVVSWRSPSFFDLEINARKKYLWLHDVMEKSEFIPERLANLDKVIVLSKYHRSLFPMIPEKKIFLSANGITPREFDIKPSKRNPHRIIWMSSHVRGLELLYHIWEDVKKAVPKATLDIYYGWESCINVLKDNPDRMLWRQKMMDWEKKLDGVTDHGKIGHAQIVQEIFKSGIWAYPCAFPEIYCHPAGTKVMTEFGEKNIEELLLTDKVLTHRGVLKPIYQTMRRKADRLIKLNVRSGDDLLLTPNHPVYTKRNDEYVWVNAEDLTTNDVLLTPAELLNTDYGWVDKAKFVIEDGLKYKQNNFNTIDNKLPTEIEITTSFARFLGYFAGDGNANERGKVSVLVADKHPEHELIVLNGFAELGLKPDVKQMRGCKEYRVYSYRLSRAFRKFFYDGKKKKLPIWLATYPEALWGLLAADGHCKNGYNYSITNTSDRLIGWTKIALANRGFSGKAQERVHNNGNKSWTISWTEERKLPQYHKIGAFIEKKIKSIEEVEHNDWVYNVEVEDDHSYVSNGSVVHNCITAIKAQAGGAVPVSSNFAALDETVQFGTKIPMKAQDEDMAVGKWDKLEVERYKQALIEMLQKPKLQEKIRPEMMKWARTQSWAKVASQWSEEMS